MRPDLGQIEWVYLISLSVPFGHDLQLDVPTRKFATFDRRYEIALRVIGILSAHLSRLRLRQAPDVLSGLEMPLYPVTFSVGIPQ